jgi:hypothetical protein
MTRTVITAKPETLETDYKYPADKDNMDFVRLQNTLNYLASNGAWLWDDMHYPMLDG